MKNSKIKFFVSLLFLGIILTFSGICCYAASTYESILLADIENQIAQRYRQKVQTDNALKENAYVNTATGDLCLEETDLYLPGKGGMDVGIKRSYISSSTVNPVGYTSEAGVIYYPVYEYQKEGTNEIKEFSFGSETHMRAVAEDTIVACDSCLDSNSWEDYYDDVYYEWDSCYDACTETKYTWNRLPLVGEPNVAARRRTTWHYEESSFFSDNHYFLGKNWQFNIPYIRVNLLTVENNGDYKNWIYMGEFFDGERPYYVNFEVRYRDGELYDYVNASTGGTKVVFRSLEEDTFGTSNNFSNYFYIENKDGDEDYDGPKRFYFTYTNHKTSRRFDLLAVADQFDNAIKYQYMTNGIKIFDTFGREITLTNNNGNGNITVKQGSNQYTAVAYTTTTPIPAEDALTTVLPSIFTVKRYIDNTNYITKTYEMLKRDIHYYTGTYESYETREPNYATAGYLLTKITDSDGTVSEYDYDRYYKATNEYTSYYSKQWVKSVDKVSAVRTKKRNSSTVLSEYRYSYENEENWRPDNISLDEEFLMTTTMTRPDGKKEKYNYNRYYQLMSKTLEGSYADYAYEYASTELDTKPSKISEKYKNSSGAYWSSKIPIKTYTYNDYKSITSETHENYMASTEGGCNISNVTNTYSDNNILLTQTYMRDDATTILQQNTLTSDKKRIAKTVFKENGTIKSTIEYEYDANGNLSKKTEHPTSSTSIVTTYTYTYNTDGTYKLTTTVSGVTNADNANSQNVSTVVNYDIWGNVSSEQDANGNITTYTYDKLHRLLSVTYPDSSQETYVYNASTNTTEVTRPNGSKLKYVYDERDNLAEIYITADGVTRKLYGATYNNMNQLASETEFRNYNASGTCTDKYTTNYTYDANGRVLTIQVKDKNNALVNGKNYTYDSTTYSKQNGIIITYTADSTITPYMYKTWQNLRGDTESTAITSMGGYFVSGATFGHNKLGEVVWEKNDKARSAGLATSSTYTYDVFGNVLTETDIDGNTKTFTYDQMGRKTSETDFMGNKTSYAYDKLSRLVKTTTPIESGKNAETKTYYDKNGNVTKTAVKGASNNYMITVTNYNSRNLPTEVFSYKNRHSSATPSDSVYDYNKYVYDNMGNVTEEWLNEAGTEKRLYSYNGAGFRTRMTYPDGSYETYTTDYTGMITGKTDRKGTAFTYTYNAWQKPLTINAVNGSEQQNIVYTYDIMGNRKTMKEYGATTSDAVTTSYTYDGRSRLTRETRDDIIKTYTYDAFNEPTRFTVKTSAGVTLFDEKYSGYDNKYQLTDMWSNGVAADFSYNANSLLTRKRHLPTTASADSYLLADTEANAFDTQFTRANNGAIKTVSTAKSGTTKFSASYTFENSGNIVSETLNSGVIKSYVYDGRNRLASETQTQNSANTLSNTFAFDHRSNITSDGVNSYTYDTSDKMLTSPSGAYAYDANGNLTFVANKQYGYDLFNRLTSFSDGTTTASYTYNGDGQRMSKTVNGVTKYFVWHGENVVLEYEKNSSGTITNSEKYIYAPDGILAKITSDGAVVSYAKDSKGSVNATLDANGNVIESLQYDAYGKRIGDNASSTEKFGYAGEYYDSETGLIYLRNRYYDPTIRVFITQDPAMDGSNWYIYCENNPIMFVDPFGLDAIIITTGTFDVYGNAHTSVIAQDKDKNWYYFYWGNKNAVLLEVPDDALSDLETFNSWLVENGAGKEGRKTDLPLHDSSDDYTTATYVEGDFSASIDYFLQQINSANISEEIQGEKHKYKNNNYGLLSKNCMTVSYDGLSQGNLLDGTNFGEFAQFDGVGSVRPNDFRVMVRETFANQEFSKDTARNSAIENIGKKKYFYKSKNYYKQGQKYGEILRGN